MVNELPGGGVETTLTLVTGVATPLIQTARFFSIEGEGGASDVLTNIALANVPDGALIYLRCANASHVITISHAFGGDGQISTPDGKDQVLDAVTKVVKLKRTGLLFEIIDLLNFTSGASLRKSVVAKTGDYTVVEADCGKHFTNEGAGSDETFTLPAAAAGLWYQFSTVAAHKLKVLTVGDDAIGDQGGTDTATPGYLQSSAAKGNTLRIEAVNGTRWAVVAKGGTWTVDS